MNSLTLKIKNKTSVKIPRKIKGSLYDVLDVKLFGRKEYKGEYKEAEETFIIEMINVNQSVARLCECYLKKAGISALCRSVSGLDKKETVYIYAEKEAPENDTNVILNAISKLSLLIVNSGIIYFDEAVYQKNGGFLRQPLDATVFSKNVDNSLPESERERYGIKRNSKVILINLDNLNSEESTAFVEERRTDSERSPVGVFGEDGTWKDGNQKGTKPLKENEISISPNLYRRLSSVGDDRSENESGFFVLRVAGLTTFEIGVVDADKVAENSIQVASLIFEEIKNTFPGGLDYGLVHAYSGARMTIKSSILSAKKTLPGKESRRLCMNYYRRILLGLHPSSTVIKSIGSTEYYKKIAGKEIEYDTVKEKFGDEEFSLQSELYKILKTDGYETVYIYPEISSYGRRRDADGWLTRIILNYLGWAVGKKEVLLKCARPYNVDEVSNIVRLSAGKMMILGIEPTDVVVLKYHGKKVKARVLPFDVDNDWREIKMTNLVGGEEDKVEVETMVGIPVGIRNALGIPDVNVTVTVERDVRYVFRKNNSLQFLPIVALIISVFDLSSSFLEMLPTWQQCLVALILTALGTPFVFYIMLSGERARVNQKHERKND